MPILIPKQTIILHRNGKRIVPKIGEQFEFTDAEVKHLNADSVRRPIVETTKAAASKSVNPPPAGGAGGPTGEGAKTVTPATPGGGAAGEGGKTDEEL